MLLSSLEGAAVTSVKIEGVAHEFTTLPGVQEDVTDVILNLKNLICTLYGEAPEIEVYLSKKGPGTVTAADIEAPADLEILNPDPEIAHLSGKGKFEIVLTIGRGRGYVPAELNRGEQHTIGVIPVDSIFSPVRRVAYEVEAARVGQRTDYDKLRLDITTDGSVNPKDAVAQAAEILIRQLAIFTDLEKIEGFGEAAAEAPEAPATHAMENFPIEELELGVRSYNCLKRVRDRDDWRARVQERERAGRDPQLRSQVDRGSQGDPGHARAEPAGGRGVTTCGTSAPGKKLGRDSAHRKALYSSLAGALIEHGRVRTTVAKAKAVRPIAEQMITLGRRGDLHARRQALAYLRSQDVVHKLLTSALGSPIARAATRGSSRSARVKGTPPRWRTSSSSITSRARKRPSGEAGR